MSYFLSAILYAILMSWLFRLKKESSHLTCLLLIPREPILQAELIGHCSRMHLVSREIYSEAVSHIVDSAKICLLDSQKRQLVDLCALLDTNRSKES